MSDTVSANIINEQLSTQTETFANFVHQNFTTDAAGRNPHLVLQSSTQATLAAAGISIDEHQIFSLAGQHENAVDDIVITTLANGNTFEFKTEKQQQFVNNQVLASNLVEHSYTNGVPGPVFHFNSHMPT